MLPHTSSFCSNRSPKSPHSFDSIGRKKAMNLSFSGCGFLCVYHAGVAAAVREYAPELTLNIVSGASAGAIIGAGLLCGCDIGQATSDILKVVIQARSHALSAFAPSFNLVRLLREGLRASLPPDAHKICSGRLRISLTRFVDAENVVVSEYESKEELIQAIVCSSFIPGFCGFVPPSFRGVRYIDGGLSDNQPAIDADTVTVSPFTGETDICPPDWESGAYLGMDFGGTSMQFTSRNLHRIVMALFPPHPEVCSRMCRQGFEDALRFLAKNGLVSCTRCIAVRSCITLPEETPTPDELPVPLPVTSTASTSTSPPVRHATKRQHTQSECESCQETVEWVHNKKIALPQPVQKTLEDAEATERTLFRYLLSFRPLRYLRFLAIPWLLPIEMTYAACKSLLQLIPHVKDCKWFVDRSTTAVNFVMHEIQNQRHLYSARFTCQLAITEMNYICPAEEHQQRSRPPVEGTQAEANWDETDMNFGLSVDLGAQSKPVQKLAELRRRDSLSVSKPTTTASDFANAANNLEWAGLRATECDQSEEEFDTFAHVVEYTKRHESLLAFYYLDSNNKVKVCEIFDVQKDHAPPLPLRHGFSSRQSFIGEEEDTGDDDGMDANGAVPIDSGLSLAEDAAATPPSIHHRDACCSPVRELGDQPSTSASTSGGHQRASGATVRNAPSMNSLKSAQSTTSVKSTPSVSLERSASVRSSSGLRVQQRRQQTHTAHPPHKRLSIPNPRGRSALSSDSEADGGEKFFVPDRRHRTSSDEYDGEPEPSDTEEGV